MDFTREPIIESVITPKEGCKIVVRSSKSSGQEEFFVDAVEVVSFGNCFFFRSLERPKAFLVPITDYEILEVREARMVLKNVGLDRSIKIGGGKESKKESKSKEQEPEGKLEKKRDRRRTNRRRRTKSDESQQEESQKENKIPLPQPEDLGEEKEVAEPVTRDPSVLSSLLPPPPNLISETLSRYKDDDLFKDVFSEQQEEEVPTPEEEVPAEEESTSSVEDFEVHQVSHAPVSEENEDKEE